MHGLFGSYRFLNGKYEMQTIVAEKEGRVAAGFDNSLGESFGVQRLEQSVSMFDMQMVKATAVPGRGYTSPLSSVGEVQI